MPKLAIALAAAVLGGTTDAQADDFSCRNAAAEIRCVGGRCHLETDGFTPMQLTRTGPDLALCAYSGCWEGRVTFSSSRAGVHFIQSRIRRAGFAGDGEESLLSVMFSRDRAVAQISWNGFFNVLDCGSSELE